MRAQGGGIAPGPRAACAGEARRGGSPAGLSAFLGHRSDPAAPVAGSSASQVGAHPWEVACSRCVPKRLQRILLHPFLLRFEVGWLDRGPLDSQWLGVLGLRAQQRFPLRSPCYFSCWSDSIAPAQLFRHSIGS